jgi:hypothetical protein
VVLETDCLPLLGMIANCSIPDIAMLRWIAYIKSLNPILVHIIGKKNSVADMLSRARYVHEEEMETYEVDEDDDDDDYGYVLATSSANTDGETLPFKADQYEGRLRDIGIYLSTLKRQEGWMDKTFKDIRHQSYGYLLRDGFLWKRPKRKDGVPLRVIGDTETKNQILKEFHNTSWAGHRGIWATYNRIKERYWWNGLYKDVEDFVASCIECQLQSKIRYRDELGLWGMKYLVLAREELSNFVDGRSMRTKSIKGVCRFILEDIFSRYGTIGRMRADRGELDAVEARNFFERHGVRLRLTTAYNPEANGKSEKGHPPIINALVKACKGKPKQWPRLLPFVLWADRTTHSMVTGYMPIELLLDQKPIMPAEDLVPTWVFLEWKDGITTERLLVLRIQQLERLPEDQKIVLEKLKAARLGNKERFDKTHRLRTKSIQIGDWMLVFDSSLEHQHSTLRKFSRRWFGPYVIVAIHNNGTYTLRELDGTMLKIPVAGKRIKTFRRRDGRFYSDDIADFAAREDDEVEEADSETSEDGNQYEYEEN